MLVPQVPMLRGCDFDVAACAGGRSQRHAPDAAGAALGPPLRPCEDACSKGEICGLAGGVGLTYQGVGWTFVQQRQRLRCSSGAGLTLRGVCEHACSKGEGCGAACGAGLALWEGR